MKKHRSLSKGIQVIKTSVVGSMSILVHKRRTSSPCRQRTVGDTSWLSAGQAGSRSVAHYPAWTADGCSKDRDETHSISVHGQQALS
jgi:hypothetical protein